MFMHIFIIIISYNLLILSIYLNLENAETVGGADLEDSVLTVPVWFTEKQRIELR